MSGGIAMIGSRVSFAGAHGPVTGVIVSRWQYAGVWYVLVRDASGGYHGYAEAVTR